MKGALALCVVLALAVVAVRGSDERAGWVEPAYAGAGAAADADGVAFLEDGTRTGVRSKGRVRGVSHTLPGKRGMVTYISPARHVQTSGIVLTPPPVVSVVAPNPPVYVQPVVVPHTDYHYAVGALPRHHHLPHLYADDTVDGVARTVGHSDDEHDAGVAIETRHVRAHAHAAHHHHRYVHPIHPVRVHPYAPLAVPSSLLGTPYHQPHYAHRSPISQGPIVVPHGPAGAIAVESPEYTGYNPGPSYQLHSFPTAYYSDGTPHRASILQSYA